MKTSKSDMTGNELRDIRIALDVTQEELARRLGKHVITVSNYERGIYVIPLTVAKLARTLQ